MLPPAKRSGRNRGHYHLVIVKERPARPSRGSSPANELGLHRFEDQEDVNNFLKQQSSKPLYHTQFNTRDDRELFIQECISDSLGLKHFLLWVHGFERKVTAAKKKQQNIVLFQWRDSDGYVKFECCDGADVAATFGRDHQGLRDFQYHFFSSLEDAQQYGSQVAGDYSDDEDDDEGSFIARSDDDDEEEEDEFRGQVDDQCHSEAEAVERQERGFRMEEAEDDDSASERHASEGGHGPRFEVPGSVLLLCHEEGEDEDSRDWYKVFSGLDAASAFFAAEARDAGVSPVEWNKKHVLFMHTFSSPEGCEIFVDRLSKDGAMFDRLFELAKQARDHRRAGSIAVIDLAGGVVLRRPRHLLPALIVERLDDIVGLGFERVRDEGPPPPPGYGNDDEDELLRRQMEDSEEKEQAMEEEMEGFVNESVEHRDSKPTHNEPNRNHQSKDHGKEGKVPKRNPYSKGAGSGKVPKNAHGGVPGRKPFARSSLNGASCARKSSGFTSAWKLIDSASQATPPQATPPQATNRLRCGQPTLSETPTVRMEDVDSVGSLHSPTETSQHPPMESTASKCSVDLCILPTDEDLIECDMCKALVHPSCSKEKGLALCVAGQFQFLCSKGCYNRQEESCTAQRALSQSNGGVNPPSLSRSNGNVNGASAPDLSDLTQSFFAPMSQDNKVDARSDHPSATSSQSQPAVAPQVTPQTISGQMALPKPRGGTLRFQSQASNDPILALAQLQQQPRRVTPQQGQEVASTADPARKLARWERVIGGGGILQLTPKSIEQPELIPNTLLRGLAYNQTRDMEARLRSQIQQLEAEKKRLTDPLDRMIKERNEMLQQLEHARRVYCGCESLPPKTAQQVQHETRKKELQLELEVKTAHRRGFVEGVAAGCRQAHDYIRWGEQQDELEYVQNCQKQKELREQISAARARHYHSLRGMTLKDAIDIKLLLHRREAMALAKATPEFVAQLSSDLKVELEKSKALHKKKSCPKGPPKGACKDLHVLWFQKDINDKDKWQFLSRIRVSLRSLVPTSDNRVVILSDKKLVSKQEQQKQIVALQRELQSLRSRHVQFQAYRGFNSNARCGFNSNP